MFKNSKKKKRSSAKTSNNGKAALFTLGFCFLFIIAEITYKTKIAGEVCTWEILFLFCMLSVYGIFHKLFSKSDIPVNYSGNPLPTGYTKPEKKKRNAFYRTSALIYSLILAAIIVIAFTSSSAISNVNVGLELFFDNEFPNYAIGIILAVILFPIFYIVSFMVEYVWYEYRVSQYNLLVIIRKEAEEETEKTNTEDQQLADDKTREIDFSKISTKNDKEA